MTKKMRELRAKQGQPADAGDEVNVAAAAGELPDQALLFRRCGGVERDDEFGLVQRFDCGAWVVAVDDGHRAVGDLDVGGGLAGVRGGEKADDVVAHASFALDGEPGVFGVFAGANDEGGALPQANGIEHHSGAGAA